MSEQVETIGKTAASENRTPGTTSPNPNGGILSQPVKNTIMSLRVGELWSPWSMEIYHKLMDVVCPRILRKLTTYM